MSQTPCGDYEAGRCSDAQLARQVECESLPQPVVLVVEDDPEINELVGAYAQLAGFRYRSVMTGEAALDDIQQHPPALIVLDLMLPDLSGLEVCRRLKNEPATSRVPVLILTAMDHEGTRRQGMACGAAEYLTKPFDPDSLMQAICRCARRVLST